MEARESERPHHLSPAVGELGETVQEQSGRPTASNPASRMCMRRPLTSSTNRERTPAGRTDDGSGASSFMTLPVRGRPGQRDASPANPARQARLDGPADSRNLALPNQRAT